MGIYNESYQILANNQTVIRAAISVYEVAWGIYFWPLMFLLTLFMLAINTEKPAYVLFYSILGNVALSSYLPVKTNPIFYGTMVFSLMFVLWNFYVNRNIDMK